MSRRTAGIIAAGSVSLALLAGCAEGSGFETSSEAFIGPMSDELKVKRPVTDCDNGQIEAGDTVTVSGFDYMPGAIVTLRWTVESENETGTWPSVTADKEGEFTAPLKISNSIADPGDMIRISSQGAGESGVMMLKTDIVMATC